MDCGRGGPAGRLDGKKKVFLVGNPNVGKSALFNVLTGSYVTVSNYPGTTVDVSSGVMRVGGHHEYAVLDTPGMYSLCSITEEEAVARRMVLMGRPDVILHVVDAKNLERMLPLTFQLVESGLPVILVLNLYDEMLGSGMRLDIAHLEHDLGVPVAQTVAVSGAGIENLRSRIVEVLEGKYQYDGQHRPYTAEMEGRIAGVAKLLKNEHPVSPRLLAILALQNDRETMAMLAAEPELGKIQALACDASSREAAMRLSRERQAAATAVVEEWLTVQPREKAGRWKEALSRLMIHPVWGLPILAGVLWFGLYKFVGGFGAGTMVDLIETFFENRVNPGVDAFFAGLFGSGALFDLFAGEYGVVTLGVRYAVAIIFPIVASFFIAFSIIEDTGYLPRLAMLVDKAFKLIGLSGRAVIPITLGFGCSTMATVVTRTLESTKERILATFLLALAIPCSAQLGVLMALMAGHPGMLAVWGFTVGLTFVLAGFLGKRLIPGEDADFFMELPPLRLPSALNVFTKTYTRMVWYFKEVLPLFVLASAVIWLGRLTGLFDVLIRLISYPVQWAGLPAGASPAFLYGFFRRDFGAAGLFDLAKAGTLSGNALLVAAVILTLFIPCVAQFAVTWKERGKWMAMGMAAFIFPFAFFVGFALNHILSFLGVVL
ncbi:MAG: ferrous iron transport protein B [Elusimicrobia bacterium]|nr:ferrous iron transport protein B [Elusimicrobiota bacterium]